MIKTVYIDVLFVLNLIIDYLLLFLSARITASSFSRLRLLFVSFVGALYAVFSVIPKFLFLTYFPIKLLFSSLMLFMSFGKRNFFRIYLTFLTISASFVGICLVLSFTANPLFTTIGAGIYYAPMPLHFLLLGCTVSFVILRIIFLRRGDAKLKFCDVEIYNLGRHISLRALSDTGNSLRGASNERIVISDYKTLQKILPEKAASLLAGNSSPFFLLLDKLSDPDRFGVIPYKTVGIPFSLLLTYRPEKIYINQQLIKNAVCAISEAEISCSDGYNAII